MLWSSLDTGNTRDHHSSFPGTLPERAAGPDPAQGCVLPGAVLGNTVCFSCSLKSLFPTGGPIRGCMKGLKALGKYVDLKRMSTVGVSYGCTSDLLVSTEPWQPAGEGPAGKGSRTGPISPHSHRNKHKPPKSSVQRSCGEVAPHGWAQQQPEPARKQSSSLISQCPSKARPGSHCASVLSLTDCPLGQCPRPWLPDPGSDGCAGAEGLLQRLQLPDKPA